MSNKIDKEMLKNPDVFVSTSDKVFNFIEHHFKIFALAVVALLVGGIAYVSMNYLNSRMENKAAEALYAPEAALKKAETDLRDSHSKNALADKLGKKEPATKPAPAPDYAKDFAPSVEKVKAALMSNADSKAAMISALNLSYFLTQQKQYKEALDVLGIPKFRPANGELLFGFWNMHRGVILLENGQIDPAIEAYNQVLSSEKLKAFHPEALVKLGICYEMKGDKAKARESYERVGREFPETEASTTAGQYIRLLELNATAAKG